MKDAKTRSLTRALKKYDSDLFADRSDDLIGVYRRTIHWQSYDYLGALLHFSRPSLDPVLFLTDNWKINGRPVEWGIEPIMDRIRELDCWNKDRFYEEFVAERERLSNNKKRAFKNEVKARAADMRKDFAKAVNDINTSSLGKVDKRRIKDGNCKSR